MATVEIRDDVLWISHIEGDDALAAWLRDQAAGAAVALQVDGRTGQWLKMADGGAARRPTQGYRPADDPTREIWRGLQDRRGERVTIARPDPWLVSLQSQLSEWSDPADAVFDDLLDITGYRGAVHMAGRPSRR